MRNVWWIVDYNRQSLDSVVQDRLFGRFEGLFGDMGWNVVRIKHGRLQEAAFAQPGGEALRAWIDDLSEQPLCLPHLPGRAGLAHRADG